MKAPVISVEETAPWSGTKAEFSDGYWFAWYSDIDAGIAHRTRCPKCSQPMEFVGFEGPSARRGFAVCHACDLASEF